ncbi:MAG: septal ring lytic transglycosylase RlpA family protein [Cytophagales bacterium]|nr:MAG: septal ring lytic transglycosylase RlpA family protein [Cytophagales bacterium]TAF60132.1 MAG: septal ring lytic transglycosylase RlpA family protein [Cytophagales bacterium]
MFSIKSKWLYWGLLLPIAILELSVNYSTLGFEIQGEASYYADKFHGRPTASGEPFNMYAMTAAHRELKFGSLIEVTNLKNNKMVVLRVNDRGPFKHSRIVDVSGAAAKELDLVKDGVGQVKIRVIRVGAEGQEIQPDKKKDSKKVDPPKKETLPPDPKTEPSKDNKPIPLPVKNSSQTRVYDIWGSLQTPSGIGIQVASYSNLSNAVLAGQRLLDAGVDKVFIQVTAETGKPKIFRLMASEGEREDVAKQLPTVRAQGFASSFIKAHHKN